jgi:predicted nucleic-acid-binding protein
MRAVDTNALVRLVVRDDADQVRAAEEFIASGAWVSHLVLAETTWVLDAVYDRSMEQIATAIDMLLNHEHLTVQDADVVAAATENFRKRPARLFGLPRTGDCAKSRSLATRYVRSGPREARWRGAPALANPTAGDGRQIRGAVRGCAVFSDGDILANSTVGAFLFASYRGRLLCGGSWSRPSWRM